VRELQRAKNHLFDVPAGANFVVVLDVASNQAALVEDVLNPLNVFVAAAAHLPFLCERRRACEDQNRDAAFGGVVQGAGERLRAAFDMDEDGLPAARDLSEAVRRAERDHLVRTDDKPRRRPACRARFGQTLDDRRVIAAQVGEDERDAPFAQRLYQCRACGVHQTLFNKSRGRHE
jgi:hypothetical protein